jgi:hypothetical protein
MYTLRVTTSPDFCDAAPKIHLKYRVQKQELFPHKIIKVASLLSYHTEGTLGTSYSALSTYMVAKQQPYCCYYCMYVLYAFSACNGNEYQEYFWEVKGGWHLRLTSSPPSLR